MINYQLNDGNFTQISMLQSFVSILKADAVILYKYINEDDLEATELMSLIERSNIISDKFYNNIINKDFLRYYEGGLEGLIANFKNGTLFQNLNENEIKKIEKALQELKKNVKVLRFCDFAEKDPKNSRWSFDYTRRPVKYLVFKNEIIINDVLQIDNEGVTALFCRSTIENLKKIKPDPKYEVTTDNHTGLGVSTCEMEHIEPVKHIFLKRDELRKLDSHSKIHSDPNVYDNFSSHHAAWMILNDLKDPNESIGCLRFEFYDSDIPESVIIEAQKKLKAISVKQINELVVSDILNVLEKNKEHSYGKTYKCLEPLLKNIKEIGHGKRYEIAELRNKESQNTSQINTKWLKNVVKESQELADIHYQIEHLFYVLKRNTYFGDAVINRIKHFIKVLLEKLLLPGEIFTDVWDQLKRHEDLMLYHIDKYRDHLMHQFHTFVLGYIVIHRLGIDYFQDLLVENYTSFIQEDETNDVPSFSRLDVIRIWTLTSLFHDCGYAFEKLSEGLGVFSKRVCGLKLESKFFWDEFLYHEDTVPKILQNLSSYFIIPGQNQKAERCKLKFNHTKLTETYIFRSLTKKAIKENDHGVLSSVILMQRYYKHKDGFSGIPRIVQIINIACLAIALHNKSIFLDINKKDSSGICLSLNPFVFLLVYCDTASEWGRIKICNDNDPEYHENDRYVIPSLQNITIEKDVVDKQSNKTSVVLRYPVEEKGLYLDPENIDSYLSYVLNTFVSPKDKSFEIKYEIRGNNKDCLPKRFRNCFYCEARNSQGEKPSTHLIPQPADT